MDAYQPARDAAKIANPTATLRASPIKLPVGAPLTHVLTTQNPSMVRTHPSRTSTHPRARPLSKSHHPGVNIRRVITAKIADRAVR